MSKNKSLFPSDGAADDPTDDLDLWLGDAGPFDLMKPFQPYKWSDPFSKAIESMYGLDDPSVPITDYDINRDDDQQLKCLRGQHERIDVGFNFSKWVCKHCDKELTEGRDF